ncbi:MAG: histidinol-phosphate transaminase [Chloroflexi bacterium]|nr:histidinol-phosphate transaminase [Chloroflexota bacterium]
MDRLIRPALAAAGAYEPIRPLEILSERAAIPESEIIKLDGNENPYGCSPRVQRALKDYVRYHIYPDPEQRDLRLALAKYVGLSAEHIIAGAGSDELIDLVLRLLLEPGDEVINCPPTFGMYPFSTGVCAGRVVNVPRTATFDLDIGAIKKAVTPRTKVIFLASPNNPSGNVAPEKDVLSLLELGLAVVVDEAYCEFSNTTVVGLVPQKDNLIVLRTLSKWAGLAGLRIGYGIFPQKLVGYLMKIKQPYNINVAAQVAALESLSDLARLRSTVRALVVERDRMFEALKSLGFLQPYPSQGNFILCRVSSGKAKKVHEALQQRGIFVRYFGGQLLGDCVRISAGKPEQTDAVLRALKEIGDTEFAGQSQNDRLSKRDQ